MKSTEFIKQAIASLDNEVQAQLSDMTRSMSEKDDAMFLILQQKRVLTQTLEDLQYLLDNPPSSGVCKSGQIRQENDSQG